jgi:hypothetical protein
MTKEYKIILSALLLFLLMSLIYQLLTNNRKKPNIPRVDGANTQIQEEYSVKKNEFGKESVFNSPTKENAPEQLVDGINPVFRDKPEIQAAWMQRGKNIVLSNNSQAESADFRNTFFHRSFNDRPVTCGEVQFSNDGAVIDDFQRFIYFGLQSSYLENDVINFDILWDKMCKQTLDEMRIKD